jgi:hypothetical protein
MVLLYVGEEGSLIMETSGTSSWNDLGNYKEHGV